MRRDYYAVLGVAATAPPREIRQAYRRLARQYSPDVNFWDTTARTLFEEIAEAYRILSDPDARSVYDRFGARPDALAAGRRGEDVHVAFPRARPATPEGARTAARAAHAPAAVYGGRWIAWRWRFPPASTRACRYGCRARGARDRSADRAATCS